MIGAGSSLRAHYGKDEDEQDPSLRVFFPIVSPPHQLSLSVAQLHSAAAQKYILNTNNNYYYKSNT